MLSITVGENDPIYLSAPTPKLKSWMDRSFADGLDREHVWPEVGEAGVGFVPSVVYGVAPRPRLGQLVWPLTHVGRWAYAHFFVESNVLADIRTQLRAESPVTDAVLVTVSNDAADVGARAATFPMYLLHARPVTQVSGDTAMVTDDATAAAGDDAYVVTLVDARYFWARGVATETGDDYGDWGEAFQTLFAAVTDTTETVDYASDSTEPADYETPDLARWSGAAVDGLTTAGLDALAANLGARIVCRPGANPSVEYPGTDQNTKLATFHTDNETWLRAGGRTDGTDSEWAAPESVRLAQWDEDAIVAAVVSLAAPYDTGEDAAVGTPVVYTEAERGQDDFAEAVGGSWYKFFRRGSTWVVIGAPDLTDVGVYHDTVVVRCNAITATVTSFSAPTGVKAPSSPAGGCEACAENLCVIRDDAGYVIGVQRPGEAVGELLSLPDCPQAQMPPPATDPAGGCPAVPVICVTVKGATADVTMTDTFLEDFDTTGHPTAESRGTYYQNTANKCVYGRDPSQDLGANFEESDYAAIMEAVGLDTPSPYGASDYGEYLPFGYDPGIVVGTYGQLVPFVGSRITPWYVPATRQWSLSVPKVGGGGAVNPSFLSTPHEVGASPLPAVFPAQSITDQFDANNAIVYAITGARIEAGSCVGTLSGNAGVGLFPGYTPPADFNVAATDPVATTTVTFDPDQNGWVGTLSGSPIFFTGASGPTLITGTVATIGQSATLGVWSFTSGSRNFLVYE